MEAVRDECAASIARVQAALAVEIADGTGPLAVWSGWAAALRMLGDETAEQAEMPSADLVLADEPESLRLPSSLAR